MTQIKSTKIQFKSKTKDKNMPTLAPQSLAKNRKQCLDVNTIGCTTKTSKFHAKQSYIHPAGEVRKIGRKCNGDAWFEQFMLANMGEAPTPVRKNLWP